MCETDNGKKELKLDDMRRYINGLIRYMEKGIPVYMDGRLSEPEDWEKLFEVREDGMFYMGDYVQTETGELKEIRFDCVYLTDKGPKGAAPGRRRAMRKKE